MTDQTFFTTPPQVCVRTVVAANLFGTEAFRRMARGLVASPAWLVLTKVPLFLLLLGMLKLEFDMPTHMIVGLYLFRMAVWGLILVLLLPAWARFFMARNLPFLWAYLSLLLLALVAANIFPGWTHAGFDPVFLLGRLIRQFLTGVILSTLLVMILERDIRALGADPALVPVWLPVARRKREAAVEKAPARGADISLLDPSLSGKIRSLQARNQYVEVETAEKTHLLRMTFQAAVTQLPASSGYRTHRSWWVAQDRLHSLRRNGQNFEVLDADGRAYPVSRPNLDRVRSLVERNAIDG